MFENYLGPAVFRKGVQAYLRRHSWGNATADDFLSALSSAAGRDFDSAFSTFLNRSGVPLLHVALDCAGGRPRVRVRQERYVPLGSKADRETYWQIPVCLKYENGASVAGECALVTDPRQTIPLSKAKRCPAWIFADQNGAGCYRVSYERSLQHQLTEKLCLPSS